MTENIAYGYADDTDNSSGSSFAFGLNQNVCKLTKFEWTPNGGAEGSEQEALDIVFNVNGRDKGFRQFPVTRAYDKEGNEVTDPAHAAMKLAVRTFSQKVVHILSCFVSKENIETALNVPITGFKQFCDISQSLLPEGYADVSLDCFMQYQWAVSENQNMTYLEFPKNMKHGKWLCPATTSVYRKVEVENPADSNKNALYWVTEEGTKHPFTRTGWYMNSAFANQYVDQEAVDAAKASEGTTEEEDGGNATISETGSTWTQ